MPLHTAATRLVIFNLLGGLLIASWLFLRPELWGAMDEAVFFTTNGWLDDDHPSWVALVGLSNHRLFDVASLLVLLGIFVWAMRRDPGEERLLRWGGIGVSMLVAALVIAQGSRLVIDHAQPSPTLSYEEVNRLTELVSFSTKDASGNSFPGDHGINLFLFTAFMWRFAGSRVMLVSLLAAVVLSAPRILGGAHWFSDVYFGALAINLVAAPWWLLTPVGPRLADAVTAGLIRVRDRLRR